MKFLLDGTASSDMEMDALIDIPLSSKPDRRKTHLFKRTKRVFNPQNPEEADRYDFLTFLCRKCYLWQL